MPDDVLHRLAALGLPEESSASPVPAAASRHFTMLGHDRGRYFFSTGGGGQVIELGARDLSNHGALLQLAPLLWWETEFPGKESFNARAAADCLIRGCFAVGVYDADRLRGRGAWLDDGRVVVHLGDRLLVDGSECEITDHKSRFLYERSRRMDLLLSTPLSDAEASGLSDLCRAISWEDPEGMGRMLAGWLVIALVCGAMPWRPHLWITSEGGGGKSWVLDNIIKPILGQIGLFVQSKTTEAGLRGELGIDARPVVFDEIETQNQADRSRVQLIMDLARQASSETGAVILKGTQTGGVKRFQIRSCMLFSSINIGMTQAADESRTLVLTIRPNQESKRRDQAFETLKAKLADVMTPDFAARLMARTLHLLPVIRANAEVFAAAIAKIHGSRRLGDTMGVVLAGAWSLHRQTVATEDAASKFVSERQWVKDQADRSQVDPDWMRSLSHLAQHTLRVLTSDNRYEDVPIGELVAYIGRGDDVAQGVNADTATKSLIRSGIRIDGETVLLATHSDEIKRAFAETDWGTAWHATVSRTPGAEKTGAKRFGPGLVSKAVAIPIEVFLGKSDG